ncbi:MULTISPECIES: hypothetical protein [unclassified Sphingobium]|uniref:hypothetical protein n=1 Tax=unclassified Sphingobium TaxID=2611147 RepID=UPI002224C9D9|nr:MULTISPECIES: hypothetical protein [unclassified Sphingobium]MCW2395894.1 hypothetical protein [Sphingobium sp. B8D3B]MCW2419410.1 hypothetical protein [Sphingobium sp. B8D3C]
MKVIEPVAITDGVLIASSVLENEFPEWSAGTTYELGDRVIRAATHRIYESAASDNVGNDPVNPASVQWFALGPTNRWSMFDEALAAPTTAAGSISVTVAPGEVDGVAIVLPVAETARVEVIQDDLTVYDEVQDVPAVGGKTVVTFLDLPKVGPVQVRVTLEGPGDVSVAELLVGNVLYLGQTEASPSIGIVDYSKRTTDDFGVTTITVRDWAKTMTLRTRIESDDVDDIVTRVAALRARPTVWLGEEGFASLTIYGFYKNFAIDLALPTMSFASFSVEGLAA